jgi:Mrp family chromosome partitioning ATPase
VNVLNRRGSKVSTTDTGPASIPPDVAEAFRFFLERIQLNRAAGIPRRLGVTSSLRGEGVTYSARGLGAVLAGDLGRTVCVLDLDWSVPGGETGGGIAGLIEDGIPFEEVVVESEFSDLWLAPAGTPTLGRRSALANSSELAACIDTHFARFDHLILELPAVLRNSDALALTRLCDAIALVVRDGVTTDTQVKAALEELRGVVTLGVVLNGMRSRVPRRIRHLIEG